MPNRKPLKVGLVGLGEVAQIIHLPILKSLPERYEIHALCDVSPGLLAEMGRQYQIDRLFADHRDMARLPDLDAVFVLNANEYHAECAIEAANHGKHVLLEKPMCLNLDEADAIVQAEEGSGARIMVAYMRRYAPAFVEAVEEVRRLPEIKYARVRDIIGPNAFFISQSSRVERFDDIPSEFQKDRAARSESQIRRAIGEASADVQSAYRMLGGLSSHDLSAMRELLGGLPKRVLAAAQWNGGRWISALFDYGSFFATFETGVDKNGRFDAHLEVYGESKSVRVEYDTPYIRHLPTTLHVASTEGESYRETVTRPTFTDPYTKEIEYFHDVAANGKKPKTGPEDAREDIELNVRIAQKLMGK